MEICQTYIEKQTSLPLLPLLPYAPITVVIPCYEETAIQNTIESLWACTHYTENLHLIVVLNHAEESPKKAIVQNRKTKIALENWKKSHETKLRRLSILDIVFPKQKGGVGEARKVGMDEAIHQYIGNKKDGVIVSLDADTLCATNYLAKISHHFQTIPQTNSLIIHYQHPLEALSTKQRNAIIQYELYLRYMTLAYRYLGHPNAFHTIGSAFAVRASAYCKQGGMNRRPAGEDFYFLQKIFALGQCYELNTSCVYPSSRISERVPFGTGKAVQELMDSHQELQTYSFKAFEELKMFFQNHADLYRISVEEYEDLIYNNLGGLLKSWLIERNFWEELQEINGNCASQEMFSKKFFERFSIFQIIKYLNFAHTHFLQKVGIFHAISCLPEATTFSFESPESLLKSLRSKLTQNVFMKK